MHIARADELLVHAERIGQTVWSVRVSRPHQIVTQHVAKIRVRAAVDDALGPFDGSRAAKVRHAPFGGHDLHGMFIVVDMRHERNDCRYLIGLLGRCANEHRDIGVAREVTRTANAVHHLPPQQMSGIDVAEDVDFQCRVA